MDDRAGEVDKFNHSALANPASIPKYMELTLALVILVVRVSEGASGYLAGLCRSAQLGIRLRPLPLWGQCEK